MAKARGERRDRAHGGERPEERPAPEAAAGGDEATAELIRSLIETALRFGTTGRSIIVTDPGDRRGALASLRDQAGLATVSAADFEGPVPASELSGGEALELPEFGMVIAPNQPEHQMALAVMADARGIQNIIPERLFFLASTGGSPPPPYALAGAGLGAPSGRRSLDWWQGYHAALSELLYGTPEPGRSGGAAPPAPGLSPEALFGQASLAAEAFPGYALPMLPPGLEGLPGAAGLEEFQVAATGAGTWGLRAVRAASSSLSGAGVRVAFLDTGMDLTHPDFQDGRIVERASFVGEPVQDVPFPALSPQIPGNPGHGTHVVGTACGPRDPSGGSIEGRYGVAPRAEILVAKVFSTQGLPTRGIPGFQGLPGLPTPSGSILQGLHWAILRGCDIVSMSLTGPPDQEPLFSPVAEAAKQRGTALIAAVGNDSNRPGLPGFNPRRAAVIRPVGSPANSLRIMGVGALDEAMRLCSFSNQGVFGTAAGVDLVGPGFRVYSALPPGSPLAFQGSRYGFLAGTSMATPHVAGVAALLKEKNPGMSPILLLRTLVQMAQALPGMNRNDFGAGLVQAPQ
jgi:hypothetical protein